MSSVNAPSSFAIVATKNERQFQHITEFKDDYTTINQQISKLLYKLKSLKLYVPYGFDKITKLQEFLNMLTEKNINSIFN